MTYHDKNRLTAHTADLKLTATQLAVAKELADSLKLKNGTIQLPASYLARQTGRTEKTTQLAIRALLELGIFTATRSSSHTARIYELAISCPPGCLNLEAHNSPIRLKRLAIRAIEAQKLTGNSYPQEAQLTGNLGQLTGNHYLTNRDIDIDDIELQLSKTISTISELLNNLGELNTKQTKLQTWIISNPGSVEARVRFLANKNGQVKDLAKWLLAIINNNPDTLYRHLEQEIKTTRQAIKQQKQTATIYSELPGTTRLNKTRLERYCLDVFKLQITPVSSKFLLNQGLAITWRDLQLASYFESVANHENITKIDPNQRLQLELIDNKITASYLDIDSVSFSFEQLTDQEIITWGISTASELELHLEAEKLEQELIANYLEAHPDKTRAKAYFDLQPEIQAIRAKYPRISPQEARKRYTQVFSELLNELYQGLPEQPIGEQPIELLTTWLPANYTQEHDYQELLADHYPEQPQGQTWNYQAGLNAYLEAINQGLTWDYLAKAMTSYKDNLGSTWAKAPNTWLNNQIDHYKQSKTKPSERIGEASNLGEILAGITRH
jgi:hypothetical protein